VQRGETEKFDFGKESNLNVIHFACGRYVEDFLLKNKVRHLFYLTDYLNKLHFRTENSGDRLDAVAYNPIKGKEISNRLISSARHLQWVPIQGMTQHKVAATFKKCKVYIDFGPFPGIERLPREAAVNGCCVIVGLKGAARFKGDFPIPNEYKCSVDPVNVDDIIQKIKDCFIHFPERVKDFDGFRSYIKSAEGRLEHEVAVIFGIGNRKIMPKPQLRYVRNFIMHTRCLGLSILIGKAVKALTKTLFPKRSATIVANFGGKSK